MEEKGEKLASKLIRKHLLWYTRGLPGAVEFRRNLYNLEKIEDKSLVMDSVPEYVFLHYDIFRKCTDCGKIYWEGTHPRKFREDVRGSEGSAQVYGIWLIQQVAKTAAMPQHRAISRILLRAGGRKKNRG